MHQIVYDENKMGTPGYCSVKPIHVEWEGCLKDCTLPVIIFRDHTGKKYQGAVSNYFASEADAWAQLRKDFKETIVMLQDEKRMIENKMVACQAVLDGLPKEDTHDEG
jgi:hypothetical protein